MLSDRLELLAFILSAITVALFIVAVAAFIRYGPRVLFYGAVIVAFAAGFLNAWVIARMEAQKSIAPMVKPQPAKAASRRPSGRRRK